MAFHDADAPTIAIAFDRYFAQLALGSMDRDHGAPARLLVTTTA